MEALKDFSASFLSTSKLCFVLLFCKLQRLLFLVLLFCKLQRLLQRFSTYRAPPPGYFRAQLLRLQRFRCQLLRLQRLRLQRFENEGLRRCLRRHYRATTEPLQSHYKATCKAPTIHPWFINNTSALLMHH